MVQGSPCLPDVCTGALSARDAVDHTLPAVDWNRVLGVNQLLPQGPKRTESDLDGQWAQHPAEGLRQTTKVWEGQRCTQSTAVWYLAGTVCLRMKLEGYPFLWRALGHHMTYVYKGLGRLCPLCTSYKMVSNPVDYANACNQPSLFLAPSQGKSNLL